MTVRIDGTNSTANPAITGADTDTGLQLGTDEIQFVTGGTNRATVESNGNLTIEDGNLVVADGHGIDFSATGNGSGTMTSELLDDYEEGTWTPTVDIGTISCDYCRYVKIGNLVTVSGRVYNFSNRTSSATTVALSGLPYTSSLDAITGTCMHRYATYTNIVPFMGTALTAIYFYATSVNNWKAIAHDELTSSAAEIYFAISYYAA